MLVRDQAGTQTLVCLILKQVTFLICIAWSGQVRALGGLSPISVGSRSSEGTSQFFFFPFPSNGYELDRLGGPLAIGTDGRPEVQPRLWVPVSPTYSKHIVFDL